MRPIRNMVNHETNEVFFDNFEIPAENLIGEEGKGFRYILDGMNAERILIAAECIGDGYWFIDKARTYADERVVFDRPDRPEPGRPVPDRQRLRQCAGGRPDALRGGAPFDARQAVRGGGEHGEAAGGRRFVGGGQCVPADARRVRLRGRVRRGAQVPRDAAVPGGPDLHEPHPVVTSASMCWACRARFEKR